MSILLTIVYLSPATEPVPDRYTMHGWMWSEGERRVRKVIHKNRHIDECNIIENLEINSYNCGQLIFDKVPRKFHRERILLSTNGDGTII